MTLSPDPGGLFDTLLGRVRRGLGGRAGDGRQFISWIHSEDFVAVVRWDDAAGDLCRQWKAMHGGAPQDTVSSGLAARS